MATDLKRVEMALFTSGVLIHAGFIIGFYRPDYSTLAFGIVAVVNIVLFLYAASLMWKPLYQHYR